MLRIKNAELIARWAESFGYSVIASFTCADGIHLALSHPKTRPWEIVVDEEGECVWQEGGSPGERPVWEVIRKLAEEAGAQVPELVARAQRSKRWSGRSAVRIEILRAPEPPARPKPVKDDIWKEVSFPKRAAYLPDEDPEEN